MNQIQRKRNTPERFPLGINKDNEADYMYRARQVFAELQHRFKNRIDARDDQDAPVLVRGGGNVADHVWNIVWPGGPILWGFNYETTIPGMYVFSFSETTALIHMEGVGDGGFVLNQFKDVKVNIGDI